MAKSTAKTVSTDLKNEASISELKIQRNIGNLTPEVLQMCSNHVDEMMKYAPAECKFKNGITLVDVVEAIKKEPTNLALLSTFVDAYEEVLKWNKLHESNRLAIEATISHREIDIALFNKLLNIHSRAWAHQLCKLSICYAYRKK